MKTRERARRVLDDIRRGPIVDLSPARSEEIVATALAEARAHGAAMVIHLLRSVAGLDDPTIIKLASVVERALAIDEQTSSEPTSNEPKG